MTALAAAASELPKGRVMGQAGLLDSARFRHFVAERLGVPMLGQVPFVTELRAGGDAGRPIVLSDPDGDAAQAFARIAEQVEVALAPTRRYRNALKLL